MKAVAGAILSWMDLPAKIAVGMAFSGLATRVFRGLFGAVGIAF